MGCTACTEPQCLYKGALYLTVELYLYSPYGLYGLYRASVPVQGCTLLTFYLTIKYYKSDGKDLSETNQNPRAKIPRMPVTPNLTCVTETINYVIMT